MSIMPGAKYKWAMRDIYAFIALNYVIHLRQSDACLLRRFLPDSHAV